MERKKMIKLIQPLLNTIIGKKDAYTFYGEVRFKDDIDTLGIFIKPYSTNWYKTKLSTIRKFFNIFSEVDGKGVLEYEGNLLNYKFDISYSSIQWGIWDFMFSVEPSYKDFIKQKLEDSKIIILDKGIYKMYVNSTKIDLIIPTAYDFYLLLKKSLDDLNKIDYIYNRYKQFMEVVYHVKQ